jgi:capsular polysaccharide biosynthesis protein
VGPFLSLIVGLGLAFFIEGMDHSVKSVAEVEQYLGTTVLATVSEARQKE